MLPPELIVLISIAAPALVGAAWLYRGSRTLSAGFIGVIAGGIGGALFMVPLNYCTFEADRTSTDVAFGVFLIALGAVIGIAVGAGVNRIVGSGKGISSLTSEQNTAGTFKGTVIPFALLAPTLVILALFLYAPALDNLRLSTLLARLGTDRTAFVCVDNFTKLLEPRQNYGQTLYATFLISFFTVIIGLAISLMIAYVAYQPVRGASIYRTLLIWPYAISPPVAGIIFGMVFNEGAGIMNHLIRSGGGVPVQWLQSASIAPWTIIAASVWKSMGFNILFYIAGLQNVPKDLIEAAAIDGANFVVRFRRVIIPMLSPITFFLIITNITYAFFETYGTIDFLTRGGPAGATSTMIYRIVDNGLNQRDLGSAAAQSLILFSLVIIITLIQFRTSGRRVTYGR
ncbi:MAG: ABC transporter permease [Chloroflexi bacterium OLB13]|nr:MAG: ABC transporter permease [Chloroflexi bacterium OLB13]